MAMRYPAKRFEKKKKGKRILNRRHLSEAFISPSAQIDNDGEMDRIAWTIEKFKDHFQYTEDTDEFYVDQADSSTAKDLINIPQYISGEAEEEGGPFKKEVKLPAIPVKDKYNYEIRKIQDYSIPLKGISNKRINILRVYSTKQRIDEVKKYCSECYNNGYNIFMEENKKRKKQLEEMKKQVQKLEQVVENEDKAAEERKNRYKR